MEPLDPQLKEQLENELKELRKQYKELSGKATPPRWDKAKLQEEIFKIKSRDIKLPSKAPEVGKTDAFMEGNLCETLPDDHPFKNYKFENRASGAKSLTKAGTARRAADYYHFCITPTVLVSGVKMTDPHKRPHRVLLSPEEWQAQKSKFEKSTDFKYDLLHDPKKK